MIVETITISGELPFDLQDVKDALRIEGDSDDTLLADICSAGVRLCEKITNRSYREATFRLNLSRLERQIYLPRPPTREVSLVEYLDVDGVYQPIPSAEYDLMSDEPAFIEFAEAFVYPQHKRSSRAIRVTYAGGYPTGSTEVPPEFFIAVTMYVGAIIDDSPVDVGRLSEVLSPLLLPEFTE